MTQNLPVPYRQQSPAPARGVEIRSLGDLQQFAAVAAESGLFKDLKGAAQAAIKIQRGLELGLAPMEAMSSLHIMEGKVTMSAQLMGALVRRAGYRYQVVEHTYQRCELRWIDPQGHELGSSSFSMEDAQKAGIGGRGNWNKYAREMLFARAVSQGARWFAPEVLLGCYLPEEMADEEPRPVIPPPIRPIGGQHSPAPVRDTPTREASISEYQPHMQAEAAREEDLTPPPPPLPDREKYMKRLHAIGHERGLDHEALRGLLGLESMTKASDGLLYSACELMASRHEADLRAAWRMCTNHHQQLTTLKDWCKGEFEREGGG